MHYAHELNVSVNNFRQELLSFNELWQSIDERTKKENGCITCMRNGVPINKGGM